MAPPPPKALPDQVEGRRIDSPEGPSLPPSLDAQDPLEPGVEEVGGGEGRGAWTHEGTPV